MFLLRVDDCGWEPTAKRSDSKLEWFLKYRDAGKFEGLPIVWAFIPTTLGASELALLRATLKGNEQTAVHGWDHADGAIVERRQMETAFNQLPRCKSYVPPFNRYDNQTISDWATLSNEDRYFFGGFNGEHHHFGGMPVKRCKNVVHLPAIKQLYGRAHEVLDNLPRYKNIHCPIVVTLHVTWDVHGFRGLKELCEALKNDLVAPEEVSKWLAKATLNIEELTAPHYAAYKWITDRIPPGARVLDIGSRYSKLPSLMALRGAHVTVSDRDGDTVFKRQGELAKQYGIPLHVVQWDCMSDKSLFGPFDYVTSCWSIQHNLEISDQYKIMQRLCKVTAYGGELLVVSSFSPRESFAQMNRTDPQLVLNDDDHSILIKVAGQCGMRPVERCYFHYDHGSTRYDWCSASEANAIAYRLYKEPK